VFTGSAAWTENLTETKPNTTKINRTVGCGCPILRLVGLLVASTQEYLKTVQNQLQLVATGLFMVYINVL
jgi:hypothetical protein